MRLMRVRERQRDLSVYNSSYQILDNQFISCILMISPAQALEHFKLSVIRLYTSPRIQRPIWLNLMTYPQQRGHLCEHLVRELGRVLETHNSKQNNL